MSVQLLLLVTAFWVAVWGYRGQQPARFLLALALGAALTHLGWALFQLDAVIDHPAAVWNPAIGFSVLFFPLGPLLLSRSASGWRALPLALAVARLGCLTAGCCHGNLAPWGGLHPTQLYEIALLVGLHFAVCASTEERAGPIFLMGFGLVRLVIEPWRDAPPLGDPVIAVEAVAFLWLMAGLCWSIFAAFVSSNCSAASRLANRPEMIGKDQRRRCEQAVHRSLALTSGGSEA